MIVIDANILIYSLIDGDYSLLTKQLRAKESDWRTAGLCLHEVLNVLVTYQRRGMLTLEQCQERLAHTQRFIQVAQCDVDMSATLTVATQYAITAYDAQYVALAQSLNAPLITEDKKLRQAVPWIAFSMHDFLSQHEQ